MKKGLLKMSFVALLLVVLVMTFGASAALADPGGAPAHTGLEGKDFGQAVSGLAKSGPGAVAAHIHGD